MSNIAQLRETFGKPEFQWLIERLRGRLERGEGFSGTVTLREPTAAQRSAVDKLLGRPPSRAGSLTIKLDQLRDILNHANLCGDLGEAVEAIAGPIVNRRAQQAQLAEQWAQLWAAAFQQAGSRAEVSQWLESLQSTGLLKRLSAGDLGTARNLLCAAIDVVSLLPADDVSLAELAAVSVGDSHALDISQPLGTLAIRLAATLGGVERWDNAEARRNAWESVGVLCDELSAPVLTLNLRADPASLTGRALLLHAEVGEPYRISVRQLRRHPPCFDLATVDPTVYVCENPTVVDAAANRLGPRSAPLICIEGQPKTVSRLLLDQFRDADIRIAYHGDYDWDGIRIANLIISCHGAIPWRFTAADYLRTAGGIELNGTPVAATWDADLQSAMQERGLAVHEEQTMDDLVDDLFQSYT